MTVVIPALNEEINLPLVLEGLPPVDEVVIVDGGSADDTIAVAREVRPDAVVVRQTRTGKGNALVCGFAVSRGDIVVTLNADGSTDPGEIPRYVDALVSGAEVAHGSRYRNGGGDLGGGRFDRLGNALLSRFVNTAFGTRFTDLGYGYNAYWRVLLPTLDLPAVDVPGLKRGRRLWGDGPEIEPLLNIRVAAQGMRVVEVASVGYPPIYGAQRRGSPNRAFRAVHTAFAEYARRWRIGRDAPPAGTRHGTGPERAAPTRDGGTSGSLETARGRRGANDISTDTGTRLGTGDDWRETTDTDAGTRLGPRYDRHTTDPGTRPGPRYDRHTTDPGTRPGPRDNRHTTDPGTGTGGWRRNTDTDWRDLTGTPRPVFDDGPRYDPAAAEQHDLDPSARHSLPMYPEPDPSWDRTSGRHAAPGGVAGGPSRHPPKQWPPRDEPPTGRRGASDRQRGHSADNRSSGSGPAPWEGSASDTGAHHRIEPDADDGPRDSSGPGSASAVGDQRRRLDAVDRRPDLTLIAGEGRQPAGRRQRAVGERSEGWNRGATEPGLNGKDRTRNWEQPYERRPGHLRVVPGERYGR